MGVIQPREAAPRRCAWASRGRGSGSRGLAQLQTDLQGAGVGRGRLGCKGRATQHLGNTASCSDCSRVPSWDPHYVNGLWGTWTFRGKPRTLQVRTGRGGPRVLHTSAGRRGQDRAWFWDSQRSRLWGPVPIGLCPSLPFLVWRLRRDPLASVGLGGTSGRHLRLHTALTLELRLDHLICLPPYPRGTGTLCLSLLGFVTTLGHPGARGLKR